MSDDDRSGGSRAAGVPARRDQGPPTLGDFARAAPGLARVAVGAGWRGATRTADAYLSTASRIVRAAASGEPAGQVMQETAAELRGYARDLLGISGGSAEQRAGSLRGRGAELLRRSAEIGAEEPSHPAYARILDELAPDEARILRLLAAAGPQPAVDVRAGLPLASGLIASGCSMIGAEAGCQRPGRIRAHLDNLHRLGLVWFSREPVEERRRYQVLEAQPDVTEARQKGGRTARTVRRSIHLTSFGEAFCAACLPPEPLEPLQ